MGCNLEQTIGAGVLTTLFVVTNKMHHAVYYNAASPTARRAPFPSHTYSHPTPLNSLSFSATNYTQQETIQLTKPVDVLPLPIPGTSGLSSIAGCAEKHRALFTAVFLVVLRAMIAVVVMMRLA